MRVLSYIVVFICGWLAARWWTPDSEPPPRTQTQEQVEPAPSASSASPPSRPKQPTPNSRPSESSPQSQENQTRALVEEGDWLQAREAASQCLASDPGARGCLVDRAAAEMQIGTVEEQELAVQSCLAAIPDEPNCKNMLATVRLNQEDYEQAVSILEELQRENGRNGVTFPSEYLDWQMAVSLEHAGREDEAINYFDRACRANNAEACQRMEDLRGNF